MLVFADAGNGGHVHSDDPATDESATAFLERRRERGDRVEPLASQER